MSVQNICNIFLIVILILIQDKMFHCFYQNLKAAMIEAFPVWDILQKETGATLQYNLFHCLCVCPKLVLGTFTDKF